MTLAHSLILVFIILKVLNIIDYSWWWILLPLIGIPLFQATLVEIYYKFMASDLEKVLRNRRIK